MAHDTENTDLSIKKYDRFAGRWHGLVSRLGYDHAYEELVDCPLVSGPGTVIDIGTGSGALAQAFAKSHRQIARLDLLDPSEPMLASAQKRLARCASRIVAHQEKIGAALPVSDYDIVLCAHVIEHLDDPVAALSWMGRLLRPGGSIFLSVSKPHWCTSIVRWKWGSRAYRPAIVQHMLLRAGFVAVREIPFSVGPPSRTSCGFRARVLG